MNLEVEQVEMCNVRFGYQRVCAVVVSQHTVVQVPSEVARLHVTGQHPVVKRS